MGADSRQERGGLFSTALLTFDEEKMRRYQSAATLHAGVERLLKTQPIVYLNSQRLPRTAGP